jgi:sugar/nucleoside kinase (ribokinase family)
MPILTVLVAGGMNLDTTYRVRAIPAIGETVSAIGVSHAIGGKGLNQALAVRRAGTSVGIVGAVGSDSAGDDIRTFLDEEDISSSLVEILPDADTGRAVIFVDETEAAEMTGISGLLDDHIEKLVHMGPTEIVITLGRRGCVAIYGGEVEQIPTPQVDAVDPTAAGDTFLGYYVALRTNDLSPARPAAIASEAAALCVQVQGASNSIPCRSMLKVPDEVANQ